MITVVKEVLSQISAVCRLSRRSTFHLQHCQGTQGEVQRRSRMMTRTKMVAGCGNSLRNDSFRTRWGSFVQSRTASKKIDGRSSAAQPAMSKGISSLIIPSISVNFFKTRAPALNQKEPSRMQSQIKANEPRLISQRMLSNGRFAKCWSFTNCPIPSSSRLRYRVYSILLMRHPPQVTLSCQARIKSLGRYVDKLTMMESVRFWQARRDGVSMWTKW